ncbi:FecR family protein [Sphingosinicella rhizophila]|uniref:FecR domain-containing protein n=1 Tax=Sphingosinicella rhizophila TaxID=3050082 RepID=A0ABU3Q5Q4_9SPHN|nr:FecR domain-containing protein [Sphingosinicella sp. GR2756]MDT9598748.1 FecR domain-containing protein [Sphingosinicella sp. GR2756]
MSRLRKAQERAAQWIVAREEPGWTSRDQAAFDAWLNESDFNRIAWLRLDEGWRQSDRIRALGAGDAAPADMAEPTGLAHVPDRASAGRWWVPHAIAASLVAIVGLGWFNIQLDLDRPAATVATKYETTVGGRRMVGLNDGSRMELNTASAVRAAVGTERREIWLDRGEAYFEVAHDRTRPFIVHAGGRQVTVLGTKFSVRRDGDKVIVSVLEGRVRVDDIGSAGIGRSTTIAGGDIAVARGPATLVTAKSEERVEGALAWREGMLSFDQTRLADVAAEFNRYNRKQLIVTGPDAPDMQIGGTFPSSKPRAFVALLRDAYGVRVEESEEAIRISD